MDPLDHLGWLDGLLGALVLGSAAVGLWRGVVYELFSLAGWLIAWWVAQYGGAALGQMVMGETLRPALRGTLGWVLMFVLALVAWRLVTWVLQQLLRASPLAPVDRGLGALFGLLRGVVVVLALVMLVGLTPLAQRASWRAAPSVQWSQAVLDVLAPVLPGRWWDRDRRQTGSMWTSGTRLCASASWVSGCAALHAEASHQRLRME